MADAYIFNEHFDGDDRATIETILQTAGYHPRYDVPNDASLLDRGIDIGVVGLPANALDVGAISARTTLFAGAGIRVVAIWLRADEVPAGAVPEAIGKYATTVDRSSPDLIPALKGEKDVWEQAGGGPAPKQDTKRNKC